jgi:hypothetical protein
VDEQTFWELVDRLDRTPAAFDRLTDELAHRNAGDILDFADHLARALHALDTPAHFRAAHQNGDFLGVRCAAVAAGPGAYQEALHSPAALAGFPAALPSLLPIAARAFAAATGLPWTHEPAVGHETGANAAAWGNHWLSPQLGFSPHLGAADPQAYMAALQHVTMSLDADPAWHRWWRHSRVPECELGIVAEGELDHLRPSADIRKAGDQLRANFTCAVPSAGLRASELIPAAVIEVTGMFEVIREAIGLPPLPPVPVLPFEARDVEVTTRPRPAEPPEVDQQGYLTLAQIQEFFR